MPLSRPAACPPASLRPPPMAPAQADRLLENLRAIALARREILALLRRLEVQRRRT